MSLGYSLEFSNQAGKFLKKLKERKLLEEFAHALEHLRENPYLGKFLQANLKGYHSCRVHGTYRIIYKIFHDKHLVFIEDVSHRKESYR